MDYEKELAALESRDDATADIDTDGDAATPDDHYDSQAEKAADPGESAGAKPVDLPPEEVAKRWRDTQAALKQEREQRRLYQQQAEALAIQRQQAEAMLLQQRQQALQTQLIDPDVDPIGAAQQARQIQQAFIAQMQMQQQQQQRYTQQQQQALQQQRYVAQVHEAVEEAEAAAASRYPDYEQAAEHLANFEVGKLTAIGVDPDTARENVYQQFIDLSAQAMRAGRDPGELVYQLAKSAGFSARNARVDNLQRGQAAARSMSGGGKAPAGRPEASQIANLKGAAFDKAVARFLGDE